MPDSNKLIQLPTITISHKDSCYKDMTSEEFMEFVKPVLEAATAAMRKLHKEKNADYS